MSEEVGLWAHFGRLFDFKGREDRASFWPYAALVYGIMTVGTVIVTILLMGSLTFSSDQAAPAMPDFGLFFNGMMLTAVIAVVLYAAAVVRRLHDAGLSGLWGLMPLPFLIFSMVKMRGVFTSFGAEPGAMDGFYLIFSSNMLYILTVIALIVFLCRRSDSVPNSHDEGSASG